MNVNSNGERAAQASCRMAISSMADGTCKVGQDDEGNPKGQEGPSGRA